MTPSADGWYTEQANFSRTGYRPEASGPASTPSNQWTSATDGTILHPPTVADGTVYITSDAVYAFDAADGSEQWRFEVKDETSITGSPASASASPTVVDGTVYVCGGDDLDASVYALDAEDGTQYWRFSISESISAERALAPSFESSPAVVDDTVYVNSWNGQVFALSAADGSKKWMFETDFRARKSSAVVDGTVYVGSHDENVYAINAEDGSEKWRFETEGQVDSIPVVVDGTVYVGSDDHGLYALDAQDGSKQWQIETDILPHSPAIADGTMYLLDADLKALSANTGEEQWECETNALLNRPPVATDETLYVTSGSSDQSVIYAVDRMNGTKEWYFTVDSEVSTSPVVANETLYYGTKDGDLCAISSG